jgi:Ca2+/H+ antiporter
LNATFGYVLITVSHITAHILTRSNAVELLIAILALVKGELDIVQASMIGSILSNSELDLRT